MFTQGLHIYINSISSVSVPMSFSVNVNQWVHYFRPIEFIVEEGVAMEAEVGTAEVECCSLEDLVEDLAYTVVDTGQRLVAMEGFAGWCTWLTGVATG